MPQLYRYLFPGVVAGVKLNQPILGIPHDQRELRRAEACFASNVPPDDARCCQMYTMAESGL
jgi:hypothetical protein